METFVVEIERTEKYRTKVLVKAENETLARRKAMEFDSNDGLEKQWNELQPVEVDTNYMPTYKDEVNLADGEEERLPVVE